MTELEKMKMCSIWLIKHLCLDTNADTATLEQDITKDEMKIGTYKITIEKIT